jgi:hypothetical protein
LKKSNSKFEIVQFFIKKVKGKRRKRYWAGATEALERTQMSPRGGGG